MNEAIVVTQSYPVAPEKVWAALTDPGLMAKWYFPVSGFRAEEGFEFSFEGGTEQKTYTHLCRITQVIPGRRIAHTWDYKGYPGSSKITFELFPEATGTRLQLRHEGLDTFPSSNPDFAKENFQKGWDEILGISLRNFLTEKGAEEA